MSAHEPPKQPWSLPDWAPRDVGDVLIRDEDWILVKDYYMDSHEPMATAIHLCHGGPWVPCETPPGLVHGKCDTCGSRPPEAFLGFTSLAQWNK